MVIADLNYRVFEFSPSFPVVWVLTEWRLAPTQRGRLRAALPPAPLPEILSDSMKAWATTVLNWHPPSDPVAKPLWDRYMDSAEVVLKA